VPSPTWTDGTDRSVGDVVTETEWNELIGAEGSLMVLKTHTHDGTTGGGGTLVPNVGLAQFFGKWGL
jgi:hypothetical protein